MMKHLRAYEESSGAAQGIEKPIWLKLDFRALRERVC
jgi:hypothetical protein